MTDPRIHERRVLVARAQGRARRGRLLYALGIVSLAVGGLFLVHSSVFGARSVRVVGSAHASHDEIVAVAGLEGAPPLVDVSPAAVSRRLARLPWVAKSKVSVAWPSTVDIRVTERVAVAALRIAGGAFAVCDSTGRVLEDVARRPASLPEVIFEGEVGRPGSTLDGAGRRLTEVAAALPESMVVATRAIESGPGGARLALSDGIVAVVGNPSELGAKFVALASVIGAGGLEGVGEVDLSDPGAPELLPRA